VLVDAALPGEQAWQALDWFHAPRSRCVLMAHSLAEQKQAREAGANVILLDGFTAESLLTLWKRKYRVDYGEFIYFKVAV